ncbi:MAG: acetyltransferase [Bacteroidales bacterium]|jgi:sugar O-acyltransferase (sialic acid O-acetyltransferase NeuD family)|nr:acetyltransferase [Bacteroidales bacterium]
MKTYIYGTNDLARSLYFHINKWNEIDIKGFIVSPEYVSHVQEFCGLPITTLEEIKTSLLPAADIGVYICVGYRDMNKGRQHVYEICKKSGCSILNFIFPSAYVDASQMGEGNIIMSQVVIGENTIIGNCNIFRNSSLLEHDSTIEDFNYFSSHTCIAGKVKVGSRCFFGLNSTVKDGVRIGDGALIGSNAYVSKDLDSEKVIVPERSMILEKKLSTDFL